MTQPDPVEREAARIFLAALAVVRATPLAEVELVVASDRNGGVHVRQRAVNVPLERLTVLLRDVR